MSIALALECRLMDVQDDPKVFAWAEKLLRIAELRRVELKQRCRGQGESVVPAPAHGASDPLCEAEAMRFKISTTCGFLLPNRLDLCES